MLLADSQNLQAEVFVELAFAVRATERVKLGTGVTNPLTRHPAVTAAAAATLEAESGGRTVLGVGRGDSAVTFVGARPAPVAVLEEFVRRLQRYLRGEVVDSNGFPSRLEWLPKDVPNAVVDVAATGKRTIEIAARQADAVTFAVGAEPERLRWAIKTARAAGARRFGAYIVAAAHPNVAAARDLVRANVATFAHFSRSSLEQLRDGDRHVVEEVSRRYETAGDARSPAPQAAVTDEFIDRFALAGPSERCAERLRERAVLEIDRFVVVGAGKDANPRGAEAAWKRFAMEVLPSLRAG